ncbi:hypothetical protein TNCV_3939981 [Trichonephila clavipes]|uniref:Uncharacterized protein n=1 Tax=Trichonephila clavipes TaxID=2585209 RepID=A0A8X6VVI3_TRICX|nr:hypothetical protein TNCV_3939981 [Trichonephila clavipes]
MGSSPNTTEDLPCRGATLKLSWHALKWCSSLKSGVPDRVSSLSEVHHYEVSSIKMRVQHSGGGGEDKVVVVIIG